MTPVPHLENPPDPTIERRGEGLLTVLIQVNGVDHRLMLPLDETLDAHRLKRVYIDLPGFDQTPALSGAGGLQDLADWLVTQGTEFAAEFEGARHNTHPNCPDTVRALLSEWDHHLPH